MPGIDNTRTFSAYCLIWPTLTKTKEDGMKQQQQHAREMREASDGAASYAHTAGGERKSMSTETAHNDWCGRWTAGVVWRPLQYPIYSRISNCSVTYSSA